MAQVPDTIGVLGAGTMGAGIAQLAAGAGARTLIYDPVAEARERGLGRIAAGLRREVEKGRIDSAAAARIESRVSTSDDLGELAHSGLVIEAAPERLDLKRGLLRDVAGVVGPNCVIATNTSSLSVTELAAGVFEPGRVVGLHFFNPAPVMRLVEVVPGVESSAQAVATARAVGEGMGKHVIEAADIPGFVVNRVNRPFFLEALRLLQERVASVEQIDRVARLGAGFRMGPFELMDLIGIDTNHAVAEGFFRQTYGEPRYQPSPLAARMVAAGRLGRKSGRGWYDYPDRDAHTSRGADTPAPGGGDGRVIQIAGDLPLADGLRAAARAAGWHVRPVGTDRGEPWFRPDDHDPPWLTVDSGDDAPAATTADPRLVLLFKGSLHATAPTAAGFHALPPFDDCRLIEMTRTALTTPLAAERSEQFVHSLGRHVEWVADAPGLVLGRLVCQLVNEASFLIGEGNASAEDVDAGLHLGLNHPRGPVTWSADIGLRHVVSLLDGLRHEFGEERYRAAPLLCRQLALAEALP